MGLALLILPHLTGRAQENGVIYQIPAGEYNALLDLYNLTGGANWGTNTGWLNPDAPEWAGVQISGVDYDSGGNVIGTGNVTFLYLNGNGLTGSIPSTVSSLTQLEGLALQDNQLGGSIPDTLGSLSQLQELYLYDNQLTGSIPLTLANLSQLQEFYLHYNQLSGAIPANLGNLVQLQDLYLQGNQLTGGIPSSLGNLGQLQSLALHGNLLTGVVPTTLTNLTQLQELSLANNQLTGTIPGGLGGLSQLQELYLQGNQLTGSIPDTLGNLANLKELYLGGNQLSGPIPTTLAGLVQLQVLALQGNALTGAIPSTFGNLAGLQELSLGDNQFSGGIPATLGTLTQLQDLYLQGNQLAGSIPASLGGLWQLAELDCSGNLLTGGIPTELGALTNLNYLDLSANRLSGDIPSFAGLQNFDSWDGAFLYGNALEICPGTQSRSNLDQMVAAGKRVIYDPQLPEVVSPPQPLVRVSGGSAGFSVVAGCSGEESFYQWQLNGAALADNGRITGAQTDSFTINNVLMSDAGNYQVVLSNSVGSVTSAPVALSVLKATPIITWATPAPITNGTVLGTGQLNATASTPGGFVYSPPAGSLPATGTNLLSVSFTPNDTANYTTAGASVSLVVVPNYIYDGINLADPAQALADPDGDGLSNLMEYALGANPANASDAKSVLVTSELTDTGGRYVSMQFKRRKDTAGVPVQYIPEVSGDRQTW